MFCRAKNSAGISAPRAFTLLEVMAATMIVALLAFTLYRFINSNLRAIRISTELSEEREAVQAVVRLLQTELNDLPPRGQATRGDRISPMPNSNPRRRSTTTRRHPPTRITRRPSQWLPKHRTHRRRLGCRPASCGTPGGMAASAAPPRGPSSSERHARSRSACCYKPSTTSATASPRNGPPPSRRSPRGAARQAARCSCPAASTTSQWRARP